MKEYSIIYPFAGHLYFNVEANNEAEAIEKCHELMEKCSDSGKSIMEEFDGEWETYQKIVEGNICYVSPYEIDIEEN